MAINLLVNIDIHVTVITSEFDEDDYDWLIGQLMIIAGVTRGVYNMRVFSYHHIYHVSLHHWPFIRSTKLYS